MLKIGMLLSLYLFLSLVYRIPIVGAVYVVKADYREDHIDYDERKKKFLRESLDVTLSRDSSFNIAHIYIDETDEHRHTFSLLLWDISPFFKITSGYYSVNFGSGLLIGRKRYISPDLFSSSLKTSYYNAFLPIKTGNPVYAFTGFGAEGAVRSDNIAFSIYIFYSIRNRFVNSESYESGIINSSLGSLNGNLDNSYNSNEAVEISDTGGMIKFNIWDCFNIQIYFFTTDIQSSSGKNILWSFYQNEKLKSGYDQYSGYGSYLQYRDDYVIMFLDYTISAGEMLNDDFNKTMVKDYGFKYGSSIRHKYFRLLLDGKNTGSMYHAPYSSGNSYPERSWKFNLSIKPFTGLTAGSSFSSDRKISPVKYDDSLSSIFRERIFLSYRHAGLFNADTWLSRIYQDSGGALETRYQMKSGIKMKLSANMQTSLRGVYQKSAKLGNSGNTGIALSIRLMKYFKLDMSYYKFFISKGNPIYEKLFAGHDYISNGTLFERSINRVESKIEIKYRKNYISAKYVNKFIPSRILSEKFQFSLKIVI